MHVDFDLEDALSRLIADGIVTEEADGTLRTLGPAAAASHLDAKWDVFLDNIPDLMEADEEGTEVDRTVANDGTVLDDPNIPAPDPQI